MILVLLFLILVANPSTVNLTTSSQTKTVAITATVTDNIALSAVLLGGASFINVTDGNYVDQNFQI